jgi:hypothetical protein
MAEHRLLIVEFLHVLFYVSMVATKFLKIVKRKYQSFHILYALVFDEDLDPILVESKSIPE